LLLEFKDDRRPDLWQNKDAISRQEVEAAMNIIEGARDFVKKLLDPVS